LKAVLALGLSFIRVSLRERSSLFWFWIFPLLLLGFLGAVFGRVEKGKMDLRVTVVDLDRDLLSQALGAVVREIGESGLFQVVEVPESQGDPRKWAEREVREGRIHAALVIPRGFSLDLQGFPRAKADPVRLEVLYRRGEAGSSTAASILSEAVEEFSRSFLAETGFLRRKIPVEKEFVGGEERAIAYVEFILPGIILMALFVNGIFHVPSAVVLAKETKILRRYFATPLSGSEYLAGFALALVWMSAFQIAAIWALGRFAFGARVPLLRPEALLYLLLAFGVSLGFGFLISSFSRTFAAAAALSNLLNLPLQFLGGLYFPLASLPVPLRVVMAINPLTHLAQGLRASLGLETPSFPAWANLLVPLFWIFLSAFLSGRRLRLTEE
jgi:ABC-2 type transport system permease protein